MRCYNLLATKLDISVKDNTGPIPCALKQNIPRVRSGSRYDKYCEARAKNDIPRIVENFLPRRVEEKRD